MRTTLNLPDDLLASLATLTGKSQKTSIVVTALQEYERSLQRERLLRLRGRGKLLAADYDPAVLRDAEAGER